jgi:protein-tyrosine phosphatase
MIRWVIAGQLARSSRPGYYDNRALVDRATVDAWLEEVQNAGIKAIICLLAQEQLQLYHGLPPGCNLIDYYRDRGFDVAHIPALDHRRPPLSDNDLQRVASEYDRLPKPVLIHCSAGIDRTGRAVDYLLGRRHDSQQN